MGYITCTTQIILLLGSYACQVFAITTRLDQEVAQSRNFRRHIGTLPFPDWELGLREAVYQALLRERNLHPNLREFLYSAPIIGHQDSATPFGDIVILARGQLYSAPGGFQFVQDPYENDCDECHNVPPRCGRAPCENWKPEGHERILALWTVKRIRHRDSNYGYRYELEYKVSPMNVPVDEPFVTRNGRFDYSMQGHTFIVKSNPREYDSPYQNANTRHEKVYRSSNGYESNSWSPNFGPNFEGRYLPPPPVLPPPPPPISEEYYDEDPRNNGYPNVLYGPPQIYTKNPPPYARFPTKPPQTYDDEEAEQELFKKLFETKTSTTVGTSLSTASTRNIYTPIMTTKDSPQPTIPTTAQFLPTINTQSSYHPTSGQAPLLPTIPIQNSDIFEGKHLTTHKDEVLPTKSSSTVRFPTTISSRSTSPYFTSYKTTIRFPESSTVRYSEPDPLYSNSVTPTQPTITSKLYPTRTTKRFKPTIRKAKTTPDDDYDIFGARDETTKQSAGVKFPGLVHNSNNNNKLPPGEQVIKVVDAPTIIPKVDDEYEEKLFNAGPTQANKPSPNHQVNYSDTTKLQPIEESYITIGLRPSTRDQQSTLSTETSSWYDSTTKAVVPQTVTQQSSVEPTTTSTYANVKSTANIYPIVSTASSTNHEETITIKSRMMEESETSSTVPFTSTTGIITRSTTARSIETLTPTYRTTTNPSKATKPVFPSTKKYFPSTKIFSPSPPTKPRPPSVETTFPSTKPRAPSTESTYPSTRTYLPSSAITSTRGSSSRKPITTSKQKITPTRPVTRKYKPPTQSVGTTTGEERIYAASTSSGTITNYYTTTESIIFSTIPARNSETTIISTTSVKEQDLTTNMDTSYSFVPTNIPEITHPVPKFTTTTDSSTTSSKSTIPITYTISSEATTPISRTTQTITPSSTSPTTKRTKVPSRASSSTTQATDDLFLQDNKDDHVSKIPQNQPRDEDLDLDLFGKPPEKVTPKVVDSKIPPRKESFNSQEIDDIFGGEPIKKQPVRDDYNDYDNTQPAVSPTNNVKIIYSDFFSPSTMSSVERTTKSDFNEEPKSFEHTTKMIELIDSSEELKNKSSIAEQLTSQSYSTSVSVEVNKKNEITTQDTLKSNKDFESDTKTLTSSSTTPAPCNTTEKNEKIENNKIFDMLTLSVVNHAKSIDILNANNDENNNNNNTDNGNNNNNNNNQTVRDRRYKRKRTYRVQKIRRRH